VPRRLKKWEGILEGIEWRAVVGWCASFFGKRGWFWVGGKKFCLKCVQAPFSLIPFNFLWGVFWVIWGGNFLFIFPLD